MTMIYREIESIVANNINEVLAVAWDKIHTDVIGLANVGVHVDARNTYPQITDAISLKLSHGVTAIVEYQFEIKEGN